MTTSAPRSCSPTTAATSGKVGSVECGVASARVREAFFESKKASNPACRAACWVASPIQGISPQGCFQCPLSSLTIFRSQPAPPSTQPSAGQKRRRADGAPPQTSPLSPLLASDCTSARPPVPVGFGAAPAVAAANVGGQDTFGAASPLLPPAAAPSYFDASLFQHEPPAQQQQHHQTSLVRLQTLAVRTLLGRRDLCYEHGGGRPHQDELGLAVDHRLPGRWGAGSAQGRGRGLPRPRSRGVRCLCWSTWQRPGWCILA